MLSAAFNERLLLAFFITPYRELHWAALYAQEYTCKLRNRKLGAKTHTVFSTSHPRGSVHGRSHAAKCSAAYLCLAHGHNVTL